jgi:hypothetical protein
MEFPAAIAALAALIWGVILLRQGGLLSACLVVLVAGICFGPAFFSLPGGPMPITIDRALLALLVVLYVLARQLNWIPPKPLSAADAVALTLVGILTFNVFVHDWKINHAQPFSYLVFFWIMPLAMYWVARHVALNERRVQGMFAVFALLGVYLAFTSIAEMKYQWGYIFPRYIITTKFTEFLGRGRGPLLNPAGNGILLGLCLACGLMAWPRLGRYGRLALAGIFLPLMMAGIYGTLTRSVWIGGGLALVTVVGLSMPRQWRTPAIVCALLGCTVVAAAKWDSLLAFKRDKNLSAAEVADSASLRPILAYVAWSMFWDRPIVGCGMAHYLQEKNPYLSDRGVDLPLEKVRPYVQHNAVLSLLVETGLLGAGTFLVLVGLWLREAWRLWRRTESALWQRQVGLMFLATLAGYSSNAMFHDTTVIPMMNMLMFFLAGVMLNAAQQPVSVLQPPHQSADGVRESAVLADWQPVTRTSTADIDGAEQEQSQLGIAEW